MRQAIFGGVAAVVLATSGHAVAQDTLNVFWGKGFYKSEDEALFEAVRKFEQKTGTKVALSQYPPQDMIPKTVAALDSGSMPKSFVTYRSWLAACLRTKLAAPVCTHPHLNISFSRRPVLATRRGLLIADQIVIGARSTRSGSDPFRIRCYRRSTLQPVRSPVRAEIDLTRPFKR